jgi:ornithine--oxo-acid transaminase
VDEKLAENAESMGQLFRELLATLPSHRVKAVRGKGLLNAIDVAPYANGKTAWDVCLKLKEKGLLAKQTHNHTIRFAPPLVITKSQVEQAFERINAAFDEMEAELN